MYQDNWWEKDSEVTPAPRPTGPRPSAPAQAPGVIYGRPKQADPIEMRRLELSERSNERADAAAMRAAEASERQASAAERSAKTDTMKMASALRDDYQRDPAVGTYLKAVPSYAAALESADTPQGDLNLIYAFAKVMDPDSVVREGEQASVASSDTLYGRTVAALKKQLTGAGTFSPEARQGLRNELRTRMSQLNDAYIGARVRYKQMAQRSGYDPFEVVGDHAGKRFQDTEGKFLGRPIGELDFYGNPVEKPQAQEPSPERPEGTLMFLDQIPDEVQGKRLSPEQEAEILAAIRRRDAEGAIALMERFTGNPRTPESVASARAAVEAVRKGVGVGGIGYEAIDKTYREKVEAVKKATDQMQPGDAFGRVLGVKTKRPQGEGDYGRLQAQGGSFNLSDEIAGVSGAIGSAFRGRNPLEAYSVYRDAERMRLEEARGRTGALGLVTEIGSGAAIPIGTAARSGTLLSRMGAGAKAGGVSGVLAGFGSGEGAQESAQNAAIGGGVGTVLGGAIPVVGDVVGRRVSGVRRFLGKEPGLDRQIVGEAIAADKNTPRGVGRMLDEAGARGSPMSLADTGENARGLLAAVTRQPGPARALGKDAVVNRQLEQMDRIAGAIKRDLGETANVREVSERLIKDAQAVAGPLYDEAFAAPGASSVKLDDLVTRPSVKQALSRAQRIAAEEGRDPNALGFTLGPDGEVQLTQVPSFETLDYMKQGMDDFIESFRDPLTGKLNLNKEGRAANDTLRVLINRIDQVNPAYKAARQAYAGPARMADALRRGEKALGKTADDLSAEVGRMNESELEMYRLGLRQAMTDMLASRTDRGDKVQALLGTPKKRAALMRAFGGKPEFDRFVKTLDDEARMAETFRSVATGSQTAERLAADAGMNDTGLLDEAIDAGIRGGKEGVISTVLRSIRDSSRFGVGEAGNRTRESIAALLTETDPAALDELIRAARRAQVAQRGRDIAATKRAGYVGGQAGRVSTVPMARSNEPIQ